MGILLDLLVKLFRRLTACVEIQRRALIFSTVRYTSIRVQNQVNKVQIASRNRFRKKYDFIKSKIIDLNVHERNKEDIHVYKRESTHKKKKFTEGVSL